ncbi:lipoprotein N-acyltransferase Lnb domain-containing protein [Gilvirhabdus luticola]|nr:DUF4105 domain-containing protein [Yeosuana sp. MJ-SS3]
MKKLWLLFLYFFTVVKICSQNPLSPEAKVSVLTIGPGTSLNDSFGHSAFRIQDQSNELDLVFNYGVYDFDTPNFYLKFAQGKLNYLLGVNYYDDFLASYMAQNRTIEEQVLNLTPFQKQDLFNYLLTNYEPKNRAYLYDFFYDNCATRIRDVAEDVLKDELVFHTPESIGDKTFRQLIQENLKSNSWGSVGIDIALGAVIDKKAKPEDFMFLPEFIFDYFDVATLQNSQKSLVKETHVLYEKVERPISKNFLFSPLMIFSLVSIVLLYLTYLDFKKGERTIWVDGLVFIITGLIGVCILLLWFATDHSATANNYNVLWAFPFNLIVLPQLLKKTSKNWVKKYLKFLLIMLCLLILHWSIGIQVFTVTLIPILMALVIRYLFLITFFNNQ